jgi:protein-disulfide isomerase
MRPYVKTIVTALAAAALAAAAQAAESKAKAGPAEAPAKPVALVGSVPITDAQLEEASVGQLRELRMREFQIRSQALDDLIGQKLIENEAAARGVTVPALEKAEVEDKASMSDAEISAFYQANKERFGTMPEAEALKQIQARLPPQRQRERRAVWVRELRQKSAVKVKVLLEPMRIAVDIGGRPIRGNPNAPVTIVEFSDFQCPFCSRARPTVNRVRETYGDRVRVIFRNFPLQMHADAQKAGEAASCAGEQGKFWEMHDRLFANQSKLQVTDLKEHATALGLDAEAFNQCLDSGKHAPDLQKDMAEGADYGVTGTPAFFINGRPLTGAQPFETFAQVIDDELDRVAPEKGNATAKPAPATGRP